MEEQNNLATLASDEAATATRAAKVSENPALENGADGAQEKSAAADGKNPPTKRSLRIETWKKMRQNKCGLGFNSIFNRVPSFVNGDKAAEVLAETDEYKNAKKIKVSGARALYNVKLQALMHDKDLYLPSTRDCDALYLHVDVPNGSNEEDKKAFLKDVNAHRSKIDLDTKVEFDMVIVGAVCVSREGYCIGRGNGFCDQELGMLIEIGSVTPKTIIVCIVHDLQVVDTLPADLFKNHDVPVDMIVTPNEIIRVPERLPRPTGIFWELLSEGRLKLCPGLQILKEKAEKEGKVIVIKEESPEIKQTAKNDRRRRRRAAMRRRFGRRYQRRRTLSQTDTEQQDDTCQSPKQQSGRQRRFNHRRERKTESDETVVNDQNGKTDRRQKRQRKNRPYLDFCVKLSNLGRGLRVRDLKQELHKRGCKPLYITWKGQFGKCLLHFAKRNGESSSDEEIDKIVKALSGMKITLPSSGKTSLDNGQGDGVKPSKTRIFLVNVELIKYNNKDEEHQHIDEQCGSKIDTSDSSTSA